MAAQNAAQQPAARFYNESQETQKAPENRGYLPIIATNCDTVQKYKVPPRGVEQIADSSGNQGVAHQGGAKSGALSGDSAPIDPDLAEVVAAWTDLPEKVREKIVAMARDTSK
jgi:hypothetical protein